ncbi:MAG: hypothetical protein PHR52_09295 [Fermentimonas sp.]|nr:hypothetical protein [Dysgonamonadaceae bacterium]MDD4697717.1 hypothetical protein [Fermentimonas sp.]
MKKGILLILSSIIIFTFSSCLTSNTEIIEEYSENYISDVVGVWYRYVTTESENSTREVLKKVELDGIQKTVDKDNRTVTIKVNPSTAKLNSIPKSAISDLNINNLGVVVALPTAARIFPMGDAPKLGTNGDWSKPNKYVVVAANGDEAEWTIQITEFNK